MGLEGELAIGDVHSGSVKSVAAAIEEGAQLDAAPHSFLAESHGKLVEPEMTWPSLRCWKASGSFGTLARRLSSLVDARFKHCDSEGLSRSIMDTMDHLLTLLGLKVKINV
jgi:hypothetical protein